MLHNLDHMRVISLTTRVIEIEIILKIMLELKMFAYVIHLTLADKQTNVIQIYS